MEVDIKHSLQDYDYELPLMDALGDPALPVRRRLLAGATVGIGLDLAHFAVSELSEAVWLLKEEERKGIRYSEGYLSLEAILEARNPYQMRLWHILDETALVDAAMDLIWLKALIYRRGRMTAAVRKAGLPVVYVSAADRLVGKSAAQIMTAEVKFG